jgi:hypothetical protein
VKDSLEDPFCWTIVTICERNDKMSRFILPLTLCSLAQNDVSFIEANARPPISTPHIPAGSSPITPFPVVAALPSYDRCTHAVAATIHDFYYNQHNSRGNNVCANDNPANNLAHEIWLGHLGPLDYQCTSASPYMAGVTFQLPSISQLQKLHTEFHTSSDERMIRLPILFIRASQGITFVSGHWLQAISHIEHKNPAPSSAYRPSDSVPSWRISVV